VIIDAFPPPPRLVAEALGILRTLRSGNRAAIAALTVTGEVARPWEPARCDPDLREQIWWWCDDVACWLNEQYAWRPAQMIPACWPAHPHIAHELPVLACLRADAEEAIAADALESWHRDALPQFLDRLTERLGESSCRTGAHTDWPAAARHHAYTSEQAVADRQQRIDSDTHGPP
jgi:hypothetical protein